MSKARVRVELRNLPYNASAAERDIAVQQMRLLFRRRCGEYGIMHMYKQHEFFESKPEKDRRKRKEAAIRRLKDEEHARYYRRKDR